MVAERECVLCHTPEKYQDLEIARGQYWRIALHESSHYSGRCLIILNRHIEGAFVNTTDEENTELRMIARSLELAARRTFGASSFNYASLENEAHHAHWHFIPRYQVPFVWGLLFHIDEAQGKNYAPYPKEEKLVGRERQMTVVAVKQEFSFAWQELYGETGYPFPEIVPNTDPESQWLEEVRKPAKGRDFSYYGSDGLVRYPTE